MEAYSCLQILQFIIEPRLEYKVEKQCPVYARELAKKFCWRMPFDLMAMNSDKSWDFLARYFLQLSEKMSHFHLPHNIDFRCSPRYI